MVLDSPASVTTMAADLQDLSRARPPPAPSHSFLSPVRAAMQQLDYRVADLETPAAQGRVLTWQWWRVRGFLPGCTPRMHMSIAQCPNARNVLSLRGSAQCRQFHRAETQRKARNGIVNKTQKRIFLSFTFGQQTRARNS